jgi:hypothetical protein
MNKRQTLEDKFKALLNSLADCECLDDNKFDYIKGEKADYLGDYRKIVFEIKTLIADTEYKVEEAMEPHRNTRRNLTD